MDDRELNEIIKLAGGPNFDPYKKQRKEAEKLRRANDFGSSPFRIERASAKQPTRHTQRPLFGDLWRSGELAALIGEPGVGKSLLATQIAEVVARGGQRSINGIPSSPKPQRVIYFDFERTQEQFGELYSCRPFPQTPYREEYKFSTRFDIARLEDLSDVPDAFKGSVDRYIRHWVFEEIVAGEAKVVIIDNISHLAIGTTVEKVMRALRTASYESGASVLVVAHAKPKRRPSEITLADLTRCRSLREIPDSIFAIGRSTLHPDIRYVKDLKARNTQLTADLPAALRALVADPSHSDPSLTTDQRPLTTSSAAVLTYRIERLTSPLSPDSPNCLPPSANCLPATPFLGLNYLGLSLESKHLPAPRVTSSQMSKGSSQPPRQLKPGSRAAVAEMLMSKEYRRYLGD